METWWSSLTLELQIFYGIGILSLFALLLQLALMFFGGLDDAADLAGPGEVGADHSSGLGIFSIRGITAFFLGFGWTGVIMLKNGMGLGAAIGVGIVVGSLLMLAIFFLMVSVMRLQSSGTLNYANAVGQVGTVYVTVPPDMKAGGQIEVLIQGRLSTAEALSRCEAPLSPGSKVRVVETVGQTTLIVEPLS